ncbi:MAG TPA: hypothetical protein VGD78_06390 [Chthoniobacterales bacterium]
MANRPLSRDDQAWEIFLVLLGHKPYHSLHELAHEAYNAAEAFENFRGGQESVLHAGGRKREAKAPPTL